MSWLQRTIGDRLSKTESSVSFYRDGGVSEFYNNHHSDHYNDLMWSLYSGSFNGSQQYSWDEKETEMVKIMCDGNNEQINTII